MHKEHDVEERRYEFGFQVSKPMTERDLSQCLLHVRHLYTESWLMNQERYIEAIQYSETRDPDFEKEADFQRQDLPFSTDLGTIFMFSVPDSHDPLIAREVIKLLKSKSIKE